MEMYERSLAILETMFGREHPNVADNLNNIGTIYGERGEYAKASDYLTRAIGVYEQTLGPDNPRLGDCLSNLGAMKEAAGAYDEAMDLFARSAAIVEASTGVDSPNFAMVLSNLALVHQAKGAFDDALNLYGRAIFIYRKYPGGGNVLPLSDSLIGRGDALGGLGRHEEAERDYLDALNLIESKLGDMDLNVSYPLQGLGDSRLMRGDRAGALSALERALAVREKRESEVPDEELSRTRFSLARALWESDGDRQRAISLAAQALEGYKRVERYKNAGEEVQRWLLQRTR